MNTWLYQIFIIQIINQYIIEPDQIMIRGTSHDQDSRFKDKAQKMLLQSSWPDKYDIKIDLAKIDMQALKAWVEKRTTSLLGYEDDIVSGTVISLLEESLNKQQKPNAKKIHVAMSGFLTNHTLTFISELWDWLDEAQKSKSGISKKLLDQKRVQQLKRKQKLKQVSQRKDKIKNYKFDVIKRHIPKQNRKSDSQDRQKQPERRKSYSNQKRKRKGRDKRRSQSQDKNKRGSSRSRQRQDQYDGDRKQRNEKKKFKRGYRRRSYSKDSDSEQRLYRTHKNKNKSRSKDSSRSRNKQKNKKHRSKYSSPSHSQSREAPRKQFSRYQSEKQRKKSKKQRASPEKSSSSEVVSSSGES